MDTDQSSSGTARNYRFWILLFINAAFILFFTQWLKPLGAGDIVQLEIAREVQVAETLLFDWHKVPGKMAKAEDSVYIDFIFILLYIPLLALASRYFGRLTSHEILRKAGIFFSYLLVGVLITEVIENLALLRIIRGDISAGNVLVAYNMAVAKFSVLIMVAIFLVVCLLIWALKKILPQG